MLSNIDLFYREIHREEEPDSSGARFTKEIVLLDAQVRIRNYVQGVPEKMVH